MSNLAVQKNGKEITATSNDQFRQFLTFLVGKDNFGIGILDVKEIIEIGSITRVPMTPDYIRGVINLRGNVVPIIDLSARLDKQPSTISKRSCIVLVTVESTSTENDEHETHMIGMLVDQVNEILDIPETNILPAPDFGADIRTEFIQAMGRVDDKFIILLAINRILSVTELAQLQRTVKSEAVLAE